MHKPVLEFGKALHALVEKTIKEAPAVKPVKTRLTPEEIEALRLRMETLQIERQDFGVKTPVTDHGNGEEGFANMEASEFLCPSVDDQLMRAGSSLTGMSIMEEIQMDQWAGKLRPFVEGEPIGACHNGPPPGPAPALLSPSEIMDARQVELRARQRTNERTLERLRRKM